MTITACALAARRARLTDSKFNFDWLDEWVDGCSHSAYDARDPYPDVFANELKELLAVGISTIWAAPGFRAGGADEERISALVRDFGRSFGDENPVGAECRDAETGRAVGAAASPTQSAVALCNVLRKCDEFGATPCLLSAFGSALPLGLLFGSGCYSRPLALRFGALAGAAMAAHSIGRAEPSVIADRAERCALSARRASFALGPRRAAALAQECVDRGACRRSAGPLAAFFGAMAMRAGSPAYAAWVGEAAFAYCKARAGGCPHQLMLEAA